MHIRAYPSKNRIPKLRILEPCGLAHHYCTVPVGLSKAVRRTKTLVRYAASSGRGRRQREKKSENDD